MSYHPNARHPGLTRPFDVDTEPRPHEYIDMTDEDFFAEYRECAKHGPADYVTDELLRRSSALRVTAAFYQMSAQQDHDDYVAAGNILNPMRLEVAPASARATNLHTAYQALWDWIVTSDDTLLRTRPTIGLADILTRAKITRGTWDGYISRGYMAPRIGHDWHTGDPLWDKAVVEFWLTTRKPGRRPRRSSTLTPARD